MCMASNSPVQRSGFDKVSGRGRGDHVLEQVLRARVLVHSGRPLNGAVSGHS
jgi:hypothetical protein